MFAMLIRLVLDDAALWLSAGLVSERISGAN